MSQQSITYRVAAISEAAGKYNADAPYDGNEDCFYVDDNLSAGRGGGCDTDRIISMGPLGCILAVADGMGGMNAGEVASHIAIDVVQQAFAPGVVLPSHAADADSRRRYLEGVVMMADRRIKEDAAINPVHKGMGSTIILAWIVGDSLTLTWCGDSRAYRYNKVTGITPLSTDHSYVQQLVNQGIITYEDTFEHPQGNIIVRSLGDPQKPAQPESREWKLSAGDVIMLCSDGLSGVLRDKLTYDHTGTPFAGDNIEDIISANLDSMEACRDALMNAARDADWYDNVTVLLCQIIDGAPAPAAMPPMPATAPAAAPVASQPAQHVAPAPAAMPPRYNRPVNAPVDSGGRKSSSPVIAICIAAITMAIIAAGALWYFYLRKPGDVEQTSENNEQVAPEGFGQGLNGSQGGIGLGNGNGNSDNRENGNGREVDAKLNRARQQLINKVNNEASEPLKPYAAAICADINRADLSDSRVKESIEERIEQLEKRVDLVKDIDGLMNTIKDSETKESLEEMREILIRPKDLAPVVIDKMESAIEDFKGRR